MTNFIYYEELYDRLVTRLEEPRFKPNDGVNFMLEHHEFPCFKLSPEFEHVYVYDKKPVIGMYQGVEIEAGLLSLSCESQENIFGMRFIVRGPMADDKRSGQTFISFFQNRTRIDYGMIYHVFEDSEKKRIKWRVNHKSTVLHQDLDDVIKFQCEKWLGPRYDTIPPAEQITNLMFLASFIKNTLWNPEDLPEIDLEDFELEDTDPTLPPDPLGLQPLNFPDLPPIPPMPKPPEEKK